MSLQDQVFDLATAELNRLKQPLKMAPTECEGSKSDLGMAFIEPEGSEFELNVASTESKGSKLELKKLYNISNSFTEPRWSEYSKANDENMQIKKKQEKFAVVDYVEPVYYSSLEHKSTYIQINNLQLQKVLEKLFKDYPRIYLDVAEPGFKAPFHPFFHRWDDLHQLENEEKDTDVGKAIALLIQALKPSINPHLKITKCLKAEGVIEFKDLWAIFVPGDIILVKGGGAMCAGKLLDIQPLDAKKDAKLDAWACSGEDCQNNVNGGGWGGPPNVNDNGWGESKKPAKRDGGPEYAWQLELEMYDFDGESHGFVTKFVDIERYEGSCPPKDLSLVPLRLLPDEVDITSMLVAKGRKFEALLGTHVKNYDGQKLMDRGLHSEHLKKYTGRVIVDARTFSKYQRENWVTQATEDNEADGSSAGDDACNTSAFEHLSLKNSERDFAPMTEYQCLITEPYVKGFDLENKVWCELDIDYVQDFKWNDEAFEQLVLPGAEKKIILALLERQKPEVAKFADNIRDKGKGIIMLLSGPPGVGKTLTAESVSEKARLPLYAISAGELGGTPVEVDNTLKKILDCCHLWNAVLLIDEADVFLESRTATYASIERNELISIFLRRLEYYQGFMFLTTNRAAAIDKAFESRIDLVVPYENLSVSARLSVWQNFLDPLVKTRFSPQDFDTLSAYMLNGREIKNAIKLAEIMATHEGMDLQMEHLMNVLDMRKRALGCLALGGGGN